MESCMVFRQRLQFFYRSRSFMYNLNINYPVDQIDEQGGAPDNLPGDDLVDNQMF